MLYLLPDEPLSARPRLATAVPTLLTVRQFAKKHPAFTQGALRQLIFVSKPRKTSRGPIHPNGLTVALVRIGRRILIDESKFFQWLDSQQGGNVATWLEDGGHGK